MRRRPKASTIHGWLRMWRGTFAGNERVRQKGRYEMKMARAIREHDRKKAQAAGGPLSFLRFGSLGNRRNAQIAAPHPQRHRSNASKHHRNASQSNHNPPRPMPRKSSSGANKGHPARHHSHDRPGPTRHRSSQSAKSRTRPTRHPSGRR